LSRVLYTYVRNFKVGISPLSPTVATGPVLCYYLAMINWEPIDAVALLLAVTLFVAVLFLFATSAITGERLPADSVETVGALLDSIIVIISLYVGAKVGAGRK